MNIYPSPFFYVQTEGEGNVDTSDAIDMLKAELKDKTSCVIVASLDDADFIVELSIIKKLVDIRRAKVTITNTFRQVLRCLKLIG